ncbi:hypothetical protein N7465_001646 [Penicillium sp. CMV-2018d]|nr:hypothetical protein N7465_001646 [Penicillium sp. CMV-2018d]
MDRPSRSQPFLSEETKQQSSSTHYGQAKPKPTVPIRRDEAAKFVNSLWTGQAEANRSYQKRRSSREKPKSQAILSRIG